MNIIDPGHDYELDHLDGTGTTRLTFVKREGPGYPGNVGHHEGTNLQEVLRACIHRVIYVDNQIPDSANVLVVYALRLALRYLERRAAERHKRIAPDFDFKIEEMPTCKFCGHIGCNSNHNLSPTENQDLI